MTDPSAHIESDDEERLLADIGVAFSHLRRRTMEAPVDPPVAPTDLRRDLLLNAVEAAGEPLTVTGLATVLHLERSVVSRLARWCVEQHLVERVASQTDGRSVTLRITRTGRSVLTHSRHQQRQAFEFITQDWSRTDRLQFARYLHRYAQASSALPAQARPRS